MSVKRIAVTGGGGQIAYSLLFRIAKGEIYGSNQEIALHILEVEQFLDALKGVVMELEDCAFPLLKEIVWGSDPDEVFKGVNLALLVGAKPRGPGQERGDLLLENGKIFSLQGKSLNDHAADDVRVLVVGNPCNTNCWITMKNAPDIPRNRFHALTRLDQNRARAQIAKKANVSIKEVSPLVIWGNHSATQVPDYTTSQVKEKRAAEVIQDKTWIQGEFFSTVQKRGAAIIQARGKSSAASAASAILDASRDLVTVSSEGYFYSSAVYSENNPYGVDPDLIFSFPCRTNPQGEVEIVSGYEPDTFISEKIRLTEEELISERETIKGNTLLNA